MEGKAIGCVHTHGKRLSHRASPQISVGRELAKFGGVYFDIFGEGSVRMCADDAEIPAEIQASAAAYVAVFTGLHDMNTDLIADVEAGNAAAEHGDSSAEFMAGDQAGAGKRMTAGEQMNVGAADAAVGDVYQRFVRRESRDQDVPDGKLTPLFQNCCFHEILLSVG